MLTPVSCEQAVDWLDRLEPLACEDIAVAEAAGRVAAATVAAPDAYPPAAVAATDGFALSCHATVGASDYNPLAVTIVEPGAGEPGKADARPVVSGEPLPAAADAVMPLVEAERRGARLDVYGPVAAGEHVIPAGREVRRGEPLFEAGRVLRPVDVALAMAVGITSLGVVSRPRVRLASMRGTARGGGGAMIRALVERDGGTVHVHEPGSGGEILAGGESDLVLVVGGTGFGPNDHAVGKLEAAGELAFRGVAISPGETVSAGRVGDTPVILLPGQPLATWFAYEMLAGRAVRRLAGRRVGLPYGTRPAVLVRKIASGLGRLECCRVKLDGDRAAPLAVTDHHTLSTAVRADGFVLVPTQSEGFPQGAEIEVYLYDQRY